jgi:hypothetical protein
VTNEDVPDTEFNGGSGDIVEDYVQIIKDNLNYTIVAGVALFVIVIVCVVMGLAGCCCCCRRSFPKKKKEQLEMETREFDDINRMKNQADLHTGGDQENIQTPGRDGYSALHAKRLDASGTSNLEGSSDPVSLDAK